MQISRVFDRAVDWAAAPYAVHLRIYFVPGCPGPQICVTQLLGKMVAQAAAELAWPRAFSKAWRGRAGHGPRLASDL